MPHVIVKVASGKTEHQKTELAEVFTREIMKIMHLGEESVSVAIEEVPMADWMDQVYQKDILPEWNGLYKKPGYGPMPGT